MTRLLGSPNAEINDLDIIVPVSQGGTGDDNPDGVAAKLASISINSKAAKNGVVTLDSTSKIPLSQMPISSVKAPTIVGQTEIAINQTAVYTISNFDSKTTYNVTVSAGSASVSGNLLSITAPSTVQVVTLTINTRVISIPIVAAQPKKPVITVRDIGSGSVARLVVSASAFAMLSGSNTHRGTDWEVALNNTFTSPIFSSYNDQINKTDITIPNLTPGVNYFVRARQCDNTGVYGSWSKIVSCPTKTSYVLNTEIARLVATDKATTDNLGFSIAISADGSRAAVGANYANSFSVTDSGAVYIFVRSGHTWKQEAKLSPVDRALNDRFGHSVSMSSDGSRVIIGAKDNNPGGAVGGGAAYVFLRSGVTWIQEAKIIAADRAAADQFGASVAMSQDGAKVAIGAPGATMAAKSNAGAVYIFNRTGVNWIQEAKFTSSDVAISDRFGTSMSVNSDASRLIVGSPFATVASITGAGAAYVFLRTGTSWAQEAKVQSTVAVSVGYFGISVGMSSDGTRLAVGAPSTNVNADPDACAAYVFSRTGTAWAQEAKIQASDRIRGNQFGSSVAVNSNGSLVTIGGSTIDASAVIDSGAVYTYARANVTWGNETKITASDKNTLAYFGSSLALTPDGTILVVGAPSADPSGITDAGCAYVYVS